MKNNFTYLLLARGNSITIAYWRFCLAVWFILITACMVSATAYAAPGTPTNLTVTDTTTTSISLSWTQPSTDIVGYSVYRCEEGATACTPAWHVWVANAGDAPPAPTTYTDTGLTEGTTYRYAVTANDSNYDESSWSDEVTGTVPYTPPDAPTNLTVTDTATTSISLSWTQPSNDITAYNVYRCEEGATACDPTWHAWVANNPETAPAPTTYTDTGVTGGTTYRYAVAAYRNVEGDWSNEVTAAPETPPTHTPPSPPTGLNAIPGDDGIALSWTAPSNDIAGYSVYRCEEGATPCTPAWHVWVANVGDSPPAPTTYTDAGVTARTTYRYAVTANNIDDSGNYHESNLSGEITATAPDTIDPPPPSTTPGAPTGLRAGATNATSVGLSWSAPPDDGNGTIEAYNVYRCTEPCELVADDWIAWVDDGTAFTDTHDDSTAHEAGGTSPVRPGTTYRYAVAAYRGGEGDWSDEVTATTETLPPPPKLEIVRLAAAQVSESSITLSWKLSVQDISVEYNVYRCEVLPADRDPCDPYDHGLWLAYLDNTNAYTDEEVTPGTTYRYAVSLAPVRRENLSRPITVTAQTPQALAAPTGLTVLETGHGYVSLSWTAPEDDGRSPVQAYEIYRCNVDRSPDCSEFLYLASPSPTLTRYQDNKVEPGTTYRYAVAAYRSGDDVRPWSNQVTAVTPSLRPGAPLDLTATPGSRGIVLNWTAPSDDIAGYSVYRCEEDSTPCTPEWIAWVANAGDAPPAPTEYIDNDVTAEKTYRYAVTANDSLYRESDWSEEVTAKAVPLDPSTTFPPGAPTGLTVTASSETAISLSWSAPSDDRNGAIEAYNVYRCTEPCELSADDHWIAWVDDGTVFTDTHDDSTAHEAGGTSPVSEGTTYRYAVAAYRGEEGDWSDEVTAMATASITEPPALGPPPTGLTATPEDTGIVLGWTAPTRVADEYHIYRCMETGEQSPCTPVFLASITPGTITTYTDDGSADPDGDGTAVGLIAGATYRYAVAACWDDGTLGDWSNEVTATAVEDDPPPDETGAETEVGAPTGLTVTATSATSISLSWIAPSDEIAGYSVYRCVEGQTPCTPEWHAWVANEGDAPPAPTDYTDTNNVIAGETYRYAVTANNIAYDESGFSNEVTATATLLAGAPGAVTGLTAMPGDGEVLLSWAAPATGGEVVSYEYRQSMDGGATWGEWTAVPWGADATTSHMVAGLTNGTTYTFEVRALDATGATGPVSNSVTATPLLALEEVLEDTTVLLGRSMLSSVVSTIGNRFSAASDSSEFSLAGRQLTVDEFVRQMSSENDWATAGSRESTAWNVAGTREGYAGLAAGGVHHVSDGSALGETPYGQGQTVSWRQLLGNSAFVMSFGGDEENSRQWTLWGSGDITSFDVDSHDGDVYTGYLGADMRIGENWLAGVSVSHSIGEADYTLGGRSSGELETELTTVLPYTRLLLNERTEVWAILGAGWGEADYGSGEMRESTDLTVGLGAFGGRRSFGTASGGMNWTVRADAAFLRLWQDDKMQSVDDLNLSRLHLGLEASYPFTLRNDAGRVRPFVEAGVRHDGGDGSHTGVGLELVSGLNYESHISGFWLEARGRVLVVHSADNDYEERGISLTAGLRPRNDGTGLSLSLSPQWGRPDDNLGNTWQAANTLGSVGRNRLAPSRSGSLRAEFSYGIATPGAGGLVTPFGELEVADETSRRARLGTRYHVLGQGYELKVELSSNLGVMKNRDTLTADNNMSMDYGVWLNGELRF